jgi:dolichol-phosphate mannosyltransferase
LTGKLENILNIPFQIVFIDDGSTDGSREFIQDFSASHSNSKYIFNSSKQSLLIADYSGIKNSDGKYIVLMDADLQHPVDKVNDIYEKLKQGYDIVVASRYMSGGSTGNRKAVRGLISRVAGAIAHIIVKNSRGTSDPLSGFYGFRSGLRMDIDQRWRGYKTLLFLLASNPGTRITEIPYVFRERDKGDSKIVDGMDFILTYLIELFLVKRVEVKVRKSFH